MGGRGPQKRVAERDRLAPEHHGNLPFVWYGCQMSLSTPLSERLGIEHPFMQAGMGGIGPITLARLAAAISEAGALGTLAQAALVLEEPGTWGDELEQQVQAVCERVRAGIRLAVSLTDRPLAVNVRIAREQPDAPEVIRAILAEREQNPKARAQLN